MKHLIFFVFLLSAFHTMSFGQDQRSLHGNRGWFHTICLTSNDSVQVYLIGPYHGKLVGGNEIIAHEVLYRVQSDSFVGGRFVFDSNKLLVFDKSWRVKTKMKQVIEQALADSSLNRAFFLGNYFKLRDRLDHQFLLNDSEMRGFRTHFGLLGTGGVFMDGFALWRSMENKFMPHKQFVAIHEKSLAQLQDSMLQYLSSVKKPYIVWQADFGKLKALNDEATLVSIDTHQSEIADSRASAILNALFNRTGTEIDFSGKKVGFLTGKKWDKKASMLSFYQALRSGQLENGKHKYCSIHIFNDEQKRDSGGYDLVVLYSYQRYPYWPSEIVKSLANGSKDKKKK